VKGAEVPANAEPAGVLADKDLKPNSERAEDPQVIAAEKIAAQIVLLLQDQLDPQVNVESLFDVRLDDERAVNLKKRNLSTSLTAAGILAPPSESPQNDADDQESLAKRRERSNPLIARLLDGKLPSEDLLWAAQLQRDHARLKFLELPKAQREDLLRAHLVRRIEYEEAASPPDQEAPSLTEAQQDAQTAAKERQQALRDAQAAKTEAARRVSEEYARLLEVSRLQAEFKTTLSQLKDREIARTEDLLTWQRRVKETLAEEPGAPAIDALYAELLEHLKKIRVEFARELSTVTAFSSEVPQPGKDRLGYLSEEIDRDQVLSQRSKTLASASALEKEERQRHRLLTSTLMRSIQGLNQLRLDLLVHLSPEVLDAATRLDRDGFRQASAEFQLLALSMSYRSYAVRQWIKDSRTSSESRQESAWAAAWIFGRWMLPVAFFIWWRRRAEETLNHLRERFAEERRKYGRRGPQADRPERIITFLLRVRKPFEWLVLINFITWVLPADTADLSKAGALMVSLNWIFCGSLGVRAIDALSSSEIQGHRSLARGKEQDELRLRSLKLVGLAVVSFGLILSLSSDILGRGTLYSWVVLCSWLAALPILLTLIAWWRPAIFERFEISRRKRPFEAWVLRNREGTTSFLAAVAGGVFLFSYGLFRTVRSWIVTFSITRRVLAYLFRRGIEKQARSTDSLPNENLPEEKLVALGPERHPPEFIPSDADNSLKDIIRKINLPGGGIFAIVGERGLGKSTLLSRIEAEVDDVLRMRCPFGGVEAFGAQLNELLRHSHTTTMEASARSLDSTLLDGALLIDDAQHLIRPSIGGLTELDQVLDLARSHSSNCSWIFAFDAVIWRFLERARGARPLFDDVIYLRPWSEESIVEMLISRNKDAQLAPSFDNLLTELPPDADEIDRAEALSKTEGSYYRLLWDYASGNPAVALHFWRNSLGLNKKGECQVRLFNAPAVEDLETLPDSAVFVLRAIVQLGYARVPDICAATSLPERQVSDALRYGSVRGYFDVEGERYHINWEWFRAITRFLNRRHLIFSGAG
jgi:hypothetical protein